MGQTFFFDWEVQLMTWLQDVLGSAAAALGSFFTMFGEEIVLVAILGFLYWCWDKETGKRMGLMIVTGVVWNPFVKNIFLRRRPYFDHTGIKCLKPVTSDADVMDVGAQGFSFPSGHSTNAAIVYGGLAVLRNDLAHEKRRKILLAIGIVMPILVGLSRMVVGVHYPTDVLIGWLMGMVIVLVMPRLEAAVKRKHLLHLIIFIISALGIFFCRTDDYYTGLGLMGGFFLASLFEEKYVHFNNTRAPLQCVIRMVLGVAVYLGLNALLKMPFPEALLEADTAAAYLIRFARYLIVSFGALGVYPMAFSRLDQITSGSSGASEGRDKSVGEHDGEENSPV